jgi:hypothetical protein
MLSVSAAHWVVEATLVYLAIGLGIGIGFLVAGIERIDPAARSAYAFRPLLLPGLAALWPLVAWRWWRALR